MARPAVTRFATAYLTLHCIMQQKNVLQSMFASEEWTTSNYASKSEVKEVMNTILCNTKFWKFIQYCLKCMSPLVKVLRLVDGDSKPVMPCIYEAMNRAKEQITANFKNQESRYEKVWKIIDTRWNLQQHRPLHAAAYYLNP
ncbi:Ribonuclease H-like superfamily, partial [Sesbania bispinosa]